MSIRNLINDPPPPPSKKIASAALAGAFTVVFAWVLNEFYHVDLPGYVGSAITTIISALVGYLVPSAE